MSRRVAEIALAFMAEEGLKTMVWGDGYLSTIGRRAGYEGHPMDVIQRVADALSRAPKHFRVFHVRGCDSRARRRIIRGFEPVSRPNGFD